MVGSDVTITRLLLVYWYSSFLVLKSRSILTIWPAFLFALVRIFNKNLPSIYFNNDPRWSDPEDCPWCTFLNFPKSPASNPSISYPHFNTQLAASQLVNFAHIHFTETVIRQREVELKRAEDLHHFPVGQHAGVIVPQPQKELEGFSADVEGSQEPICRPMPQPPSKITQIPPLPQGYHLVL